MGTGARVDGAPPHVGVVARRDNEAGDSRDNVLAVAGSRCEAFVALAVWRPVDVTTATPTLAVTTDHVQFIDLQLLAQKNDNVLKEIVVLCTTPQYVSTLMYFT